MLKSMYRERSDFEKRGLDEDVINLRFKHYQYSLIDTINRILEERRRLSNLHILFYCTEMEMQREDIRLGTNNTNNGYNAKPKP